ncbi:MAG: hypothetical protein K8H86_03430 [Ignavibacteriaceae bacterium]|nr:hypothetical protein [Ignavibacteriaceae bacterium]
MYRSHRTRSTSKQPKLIRANSWNPCLLDSGAVVCVLLWRGVNGTQIFTEIKNPDINAGAIEKK